MIRAFTLLALLAATSPALAATKIDIGQKNDRKDVLTKDAENWIIPDGPSATFRANNITFSLRPATGTLAGALWKGGLDTGATLATDGVTVKGAHGVPELPLTLSGL